jgi:hypothetical protein
LRGREKREIERKTKRERKNDKEGEKRERERCLVAWYQPKPACIMK